MAASDQSVAAAPSMSWEAAVGRLRADPGQRALVQACFYDDPLLQAAERYLASSEWIAVRGLIGPGAGRALDVGAGRGIASFALARDGWQVTALEPDPSNLVGAGAITGLARDAGLAIDVTQTWGEQLPFANDSFTVVHCRQVLHHARDLKQLCSELARVLAPGGALLATREHVISRPEDLPIFLKSHPVHALYGGEHAYLLQEYRDAIGGAGLRLDREFNPYESDINSYPESLPDIKRRWAGRLHLPSPAWIPDVALSWVGERSHKPGRLYTFLARKPGAQP
jgi:SAM-dependent methyltransferase